MKFPLLTWSLIFTHMLLTCALMFSKDISVQLVLGCWFFLHIGQLFHFSFLVSSFWILYSHLLQPSSYRIHPSRGHSSLLWWVHSTSLLLMGMWASWFMTHLMKYSISLTNAKKIPKEVKECQALAHAGKIYCTIREKYGSRQQVGHESVVCHC